MVVELGSGRVGGWEPEGLEWRESDWVCASVGVSGAVSVSEKFVDGKGKGTSTAERGTRTTGRPSASVCTGVEEEEGHGQPGAWLILPPILCVVVVVVVWLGVCGGLGWGWDGVGAAGVGGFGAVGRGS